MSDEEEKVDERDGRRLVGVPEELVPLGDADTIIVEHE